MKGSCLCGAVTFETKAEPQSLSVCHCSQCRKQSGHLWASAHVADGELMIKGDVRWFQSSNDAKRGFCPTCGSFLFWKHAEDPIALEDTLDRKARGLTADAKVARLKLQKVLDSMPSLRAYRD